jgi:hypothetical protein
MTDVVKIAKECRESLFAEITKLDEFLAMTDKLMKFNGQQLGASPKDHDDETTELTNAAIMRPYPAGAGANRLDPKQ